MVASWLHIAAMNSGLFLLRLVGVDRRVGEEEPHDRLVAIHRGRVQRRK